MDAANVKLAITFNDSTLDADEKDIEVQKLMSQLKHLDVVEAVSRVLDPNPPYGNKSLGGFLVDILTLEVSPVNFKTLFNFLGDRLGGKPIELEVEANGRRLKVSASSQAELVVAIKAAQEFITAEEG